MLISLQTHAQEISVPDSIAIILKPYENMDSTLTRYNFVKKSLKATDYKLPIKLINDSTSVFSIIALLSSGERVIRTLDYDTNQQLYSLKRLPNGDYDLKSGFTADDNLNIYGLIVLFRTGGYELIWIGRDEVEIGRERWHHPNICIKLKEFVDNF